MTNMETYDDFSLGIMLCVLIGLVLMLILSGYTYRDNYYDTHKTQTKCDHDWEYDGENGSRAGAFYFCKKCGKHKYIPYRELMAMSEKEYKFWTTRPPTIQEKYRQAKINEHKKNIL